MRLTLARAKWFTLDSAARHGLNVEVVSARWIGERSPYKYGPGYWRAAVVRVRSLETGAEVNKSVTVESDGGGRVS